MICLSPDTLDTDLLLQMRGGVALNDLVRNLLLIRTVGAARPPVFRLGCDFYDQTVLELERLAPFCEEHGVGPITFWQLVKYPDLPDALNARPIPSLPEAERRICVEVFERAVAVLQSRGIAVAVAGGFMEDCTLAVQAA